MGIEISIVVQSTKMYTSCQHCLLKKRSHSKSVLCFFFFETVTGFQITPCLYLQTFLDYELHNPSNAPAPYCQEDPPYGVVP